MPTAPEAQTATVPVFTHPAVREATLRLCGIRDARSDNPRNASQAEEDEARAAMQEAYRNHHNQDGPWAIVEDRDGWRFGAGTLGVGDDRETAEWNARHGAWGVPVGIRPASDIEIEESAR